MQIYNIVYHIVVVLKGDDYMGDFSILANRIKELRTKFNVTQKEFAAKVGCTAATLSAYENGSKSPSLEIIKGIAEKCDVSIDWLCGLSDKENNKENDLSYSDIIEMLFTIENNLDITLIEEEYTVEDIDLNTGYPTPYTNTYTIIRFNNKTANLFLTDWNKMKNLHDSGSIDDEVYSLWIEKTLLKYKDKKAEGKGWDNIKEELPFY